MPVAPRLSFPATATLIVLAGAAGAACPVPGDLSRGISVTFDDGATEAYVAAHPGVVRLERSFDGATESVMDLGHGVYVLTYMDVFDGRADLGSRIATSFPGGLASIVPPEEGQRWTASTLVLDMASGPYEEEVTVAWGSPRETQIGACTYTAIDGIIAYRSGSDYYEGVVYLPELGFGYLAWSEDDGGRGDYTATAIEAR